MQVESTGRRILVECVGVDVWVMAALGGILVLYEFIFISFQVCLFSRVFLGIYVKREIMLVFDDFFVLI